MRLRHLLFPLALFAPAALRGQEVLESPGVFVGGIPFSLELAASPDVDTPYRVETSGGRLLAEGAVPAGGTATVADLAVTGRSELPVRVQLGAETLGVSAPYVPGWFSILPPVVAILLALALKEVVVSLVAGVWLGALAVAGFNPLAATWRVVDDFVVPALGDTGGQTQIVVFSLLLGGMV
jgi:hypothetical protein